MAKLAEEITILKKQIADLQKATNIVEDLSIDEIKAELSRLKLEHRKLSVRHSSRPQEGDSFKMVALEAAIGRCLLRLDGML